MLIIARELDNVKRKANMYYYVINNNATHNPGYHHEVHTQEHADRLGILNRTNLGWFANEVEAVRYAKTYYYYDADGCAICCPRAHKG